MLNDELQLVGTPGTVRVTAAATDFSQPGRTLRNSGTGVQVMIAGQTSKENPGYTTARKTIRVTETLTGLSNTLNPTAKVYAQLILSYPEGEVSAGNLAAVIAQVVNLFKNGGTSSAGFLDFTNSDLQAVITRIMRGET